VIVIVTKATAFMGAAADAANTLRKLALPTHRREVVSSSLSNLPAALRTRNKKAHVVVILAQPLYCWRHATNTAFLKRVSTFLAKMLAIICCVWLRPNLTAAFIACIRKQNLLSGRTMVVVENAETQTEVWFSTNLAKRPRTVNEVVLALVPTQLEVLNPVVMSNLIDVVDFLFGPKEPSDVFFHDQSVLPDVSPIVAMRMIWEFDPDIAVLVFVLISRFSIRYSVHNERSLRASHIMST